MLLVEVDFGSKNQVVKWLEQFESQDTLSTIGGGWCGSKGH